MDNETVKNLWIGVAGGVGGSAGWALLCFLGHCVKNFWTWYAFRDAITEHSGPGGANYQTGEFIILVRNLTRWPLTIRSVNLSSQNDCSQPLPLRHGSNMELGKLTQITIPPRWGESWRISLPEKVEPKSGYVEFEIDGLFGGTVVRRAYFTKHQMQLIRQAQLGALNAKARLENSTKGRVPGRS
jgi:hypothetical protein